MITLRSMMKSKLYIFINILGMAISIACCITAYYNWEFNASFDSYHKQAAEIYRVNSLRSFQNRITEYGNVPLPMGSIVRENFNDVKALTRYSSTYAEYKIEDEIFDGGLAYVDPDFFEMFTCEFIAGTKSSINNKTSILISEELV